MKFILPINWNKGWLDVEAELIDVAPHLASVLTFAIHRNQEGSLRYGRWQVSNIETGMHLYTGESRQKTIEGATNKCAKATIHGARAGILKAVAQAPQLAREAA